MGDGREGKLPRDMRATGPDVQRHRSSKDTKRWCKGKVGREHRGRWVLAHELKRSRYPSEWRVFACTECRRQLNHSWPMGEVVPGLEPRATCKCGANGRGVVTRDNFVCKETGVRGRMFVHYTCPCGFAWQTAYERPTPTRKGAP